jgi:HK97 gp10 family phage protein
VADEGITIQLKGDRDCIAAFKELREFVKGNPLRNAVRSAAQIMLAEIYSRAPVGDAANDPHSGQLVSNLRVAIRKTASTIRGRVVINAKAFYWRFVEFGTAHAPAYPFITPAFEARQQEAAQEVIDEFSRGLDKAEARARRAGAL